MIDGLLAPPRLLDSVENFTLFYKESQKIIAQNRQFISVNNAYRRFERRAETQLTEDLIKIIDVEEIDGLQQEKLVNRFAKETEVIRRDDRLDTIAQDIVEHFPTRGYLGKGMVISLDKFTAVTMYDKFQHRW